MTPHDLARRLQAGGPALLQHLARRLQAAALTAEAEAKRNATSRPRVRSGRLRGSIAGSVEGSPADPILALRAGGGAGLVYARTQEGPADGSSYTVIRPRRGKYLAIPYGSALTGAGVHRGQGGPVRLVREVRIPATRFLERAFVATRQRLATDLQGLLNAALEVS